MIHEKKWQIGLIEIKNCSAKDIVKNMRRQAVDGEKIFAKKHIW